jgi:hypothetical protein
MRLTTLFFALLPVSLLAEQSVSPVGFTESRHSIRAFSPSGEVTLPVVRVQLDVVYTHGRKERGDLVVVYDPQNGHYFWRYRSLNSPGDTGSFLDALEASAEAAYVGPDALFDFNMSSALYEKEHRERAGSMGAAESASIAEIERGLPVFEGAGYHTDASALHVLDAIDADFSCAPLPLTAICMSSKGNHIVSISREGDNWRFVFRNRFDVEVILDSKFNLVSTRRLTEPAKE